VSATVDDADSSSPQVEEVDLLSAHRWRNLLLSGGCYLLLSIGMWWRLWSNHPTSTSICGCGDTSLFTWFLKWPAYALPHGLNPFYSTAMGYPHGVNLLANTSVLAVGVPLAPITWIFGPIATLNVALTISPVISGLAMFALLRRWVSWAPAAFLGGLLYGFSPFILTSLDYSHLMSTMGPVPPLVVACLDELLIRQRRRAVATGVLLGLLVTLQFFLGTELLVMTLIVAIFGVAVVVLYAAWRRPEALREHARYAFVGLTAGVTTALILLAYPTWFALAGPAHLSGSIWPLALDQYVSHLKEYFIPPPSVSAVSYGYGFNGLILSPQYLGIGLLLVLAGSIVAWRRDLRLSLFALIGVFSVALALGAANPVLGNLPLLENILPYRFDYFVFLSAAIMLGIVVDHTHTSVNCWYARARRGVVDRKTVPAEELGQGIGSQSRDPARKPPRGWAGGLGGLIVAGIALVPLGVYLSQNVPIPVQPLEVPSWFRTVAPHLGRGQVLLTFPDTLSVESAMTWQTLNDMRYSMVDEGGPGGDTSRAGVEAPGQGVIGIASLPASVSAPLGKAANTITPGKIAAVRSALRRWGVTTVVIPDENSLPAYEQIPSVTAAAALIMAATGQRPVYKEGAWVWTAINHARRPSLVTTTSKFEACTSAGTRGSAAVDTALACVTSKGLFLRLVPSFDGTNLIRQHVLVTTAADNVPITNVDFVISGTGISGPMSVPAHPFVYGPLAGWFAKTKPLGLPNGTYTLHSVAHDAAGTVGRSSAVTVRIDNG
jgi:hypothetical protein